MKKLVFILMLFVSFIMVGCSKDTKASKAMDNFTSSISEASSYLLKGDMVLKREASTVTLNMEVYYKAPESYKVIYKNNQNNSKQILLKNDDGVYVLSPELNKEFKFESTWPLNSSHIYILNKVVADLKADDKASVKEEGDYYVLSSTISHKVKKDLVSQSVYLNKKDYTLNRITYNTETEALMTFNVSSCEFDKAFSADEFNVDKIMASETSSLGEGTSGEVSSILFGDVIEGDSLTSSNVSNDMTVLNYSGTSAYVIVYGKTDVASVATVSRVYNDFVILDETIGFVSTNALTFYLKGREFKIISNALSLEQMVTVANSLKLS